MYNYDDPQYIAAADQLRAARQAYFDEVAKPSAEIETWRNRVDDASDVYEVALMAVRREEDRVLDAATRAKFNAYTERAKVRFA